MAPASTTDTPDELLYQRTLAGDEAALADLVRRYHGPLLRFLQRLTDQRMIAEDLVQETFTRLITYRGAAPNSFRTWAFTVARNLARDQFRSASYRREEAESFEEWDERPDALRTTDAGAEELATISFQRAEVAALLQKLPDAAREVLVLRFYHDLPLEQIAAVVGVPVGTVKSRLFYALKTLKAALRAEDIQLE